jgi:AraC family transcriptional regulator
MLQNLGPAAGRRFRNVAAPTFRLLFGGEGVGLFDWRCPGCDTPAHQEEYNDAYEIVVVRRGAFLREVDGVPAFVAAGTLTLAAPGEVHRIHHPVPGGDACSVFRASADGVREMLGAMDPSQRDSRHPRFPLSQAPLGGREYLLHRLALRAAATGADLVEQEESAIRFLSAALAYAWARSNGSAGRVPRLTGPAWARALEYTARVQEVIGRRFHERLTLAKIGCAVQCSPFHLSRLFASVTGLPIHRALLRHRLRHALERVLDSGESLSAIAFSTGFSSHSHLTDAFRREFGCSPDLIRRRLPPRAGASATRAAMPGRSVGSGLVTKVEDLDGAELSAGAMDPEH